MGQGVEEPLTLESNEAEAARDAGSAVVDHHGVLKLTKSLEVFLHHDVVRVPREAPDEELASLTIKNFERPSERLQREG